MQIRSNGASPPGGEMPTPRRAPSAGLPEAKSEKASKMLYFCLNTELNFR
jgi:hypothetical protein